MNNLENMSKKLIEYVNGNALMTALGYFEGEIRPVVEDLDTYENQELLNSLKELCVFISNQDWNDALINIEQMSEILNNNQ